MSRNALQKIVGLVFCISEDKAIITFAFLLQYYDQLTENLQISDPPLKDVQLIDEPLLGHKKIISFIVSSSLSK